jgi:hypothetical protein
MQPPRYLSATVRVYRSPAVSAKLVPFSIKIDGAEQMKIASGQTVEIEVAPGRHRIKMSMWSGQGSKAVTFDIDAGQVLGFRCQGSMNVLYPIELVADGYVGSQGPDTRQADWQRQPPAPPQRPDRVEVIEHDQYEEPLGEEARVIDNSNSITGVTRRVTASREWSRTVTIGGEQNRTVGGELGGGVSWLSAKATIEQELHRTYSTEAQAKQVFAEEITITVPERTSVKLVLRWKRIWQRGVVRVTRPDETFYDVPYQVVVNVTFDQSQQDAADPRPWMPGGA